MNSFGQFLFAVLGYVIVLAFMSVGPLMVGFGIRDVIETRHWIDTSVPTTAIVEERHPRGDEGEFEATVLFNSLEGEEVSAKIVGTEVGKPGSKVAIRYDPADPTSARMSFWMPFGVGSLIGLAVGTIFLSFTVLLLVQAARASFRAVVRDESSQPRDWAV